MLVGGRVTVLCEHRNDTDPDRNGTWKDQESSRSPFNPVRPFAEPMSRALLAKGKEWKGCGNRTRKNRNETEK